MKQKNSSRKGKAIGFGQPADGKSIASVRLGESEELSDDPNLREYQISQRPTEWYAFRVTLKDGREFNGLYHPVLRNDKLIGETVFSRDDLKVFVPGLRAELETRLNRVMKKRIESADVLIVG